MNSFLRKQINSLKSLPVFDKLYWDVFDKWRWEIRMILQEQNLRSQGSWTWPQRIADVLACPDNAAIPRVANAGQINGPTQIMHNGTRVLRRGYYGYPVEKMIRLNRGVHEPQEERIFQEMLKTVPDGGKMIELGAYWAFYSLWFASAIKDATSIMVEPLNAHLEIGRKNFALNGHRGEFIRALVGKESHSAGTEQATVCVDDLLSQYSIRYLDILHADIQEAELEMLKGSQRAITARAIGAFVISTHTEILHEQCENYLKVSGYEILASIPLKNSYQDDGLLVASLPGKFEILKGIQLSRK